MGSIIRYKTGTVIALALAVAVSTNCGIANPPEIEEPRAIAFDWPESTPMDQGLDGGLIEDAYVDASRTSFVLSLLIVKNGFLVSEAYFNGSGQEFLNSTFSVTKSITSTLVGLALHEGYIDSIDQRMLDFFPEYTALNDARKNDITIRHLLTMQSGFEHETNLSSIIDTARNTVAAILESGLRFDPGSDFLYSTHGSHLLSAIVTRATGRNSNDYALAKIFRPIGVDSIAWATDFNGVSYGGAGLWMTPRDMARFGYLFLHGGNLDGQQVIPEEWVTIATQNHRSHTTTWEEMSDVGYGFQWWTGEVRHHRLFFASGFGGQWIVVIPTLDMVVVSTANAYSESTEWEQMEYLIELMDMFLLPAADSQ